MTILVYANKEFGCDSLLTRNELAFSNVQKIFPVWSNNTKTGLFVGVAGIYSETYKILEYFRSFLDQEMPEKPTLPDNVGGILVDPLTERVYWFESNLEPVEMPIDSVLAEGTGDSYCIGALAAGATVQKALEIVSDKCTTCGGPLTVLTMTAMKDILKEKLKKQETCCLMRYRLLRTKGVK